MKTLGVAVVNRMAIFRPNYLIWTLIGIEALLVLLWSTNHSALIESHYGVGLTDQYNKLGRMLFQGHGYRFILGTGPTLMREPGFPLLLAGIYTLFGRGLVQVRLVNLLMTGLAASLLSRLAQRLAPGPVAAVLAPLLFLLHPGILVAELRVGVEIPFLLLALCFLYVLDYAVQSGKLTVYLAAGLVLGVTSVVRSTALLFPICLPVYFFLVSKPRPSIVAMGTRVAIVMAAALLVLTPWMIRNYRLVGAPVATASVGGVAAHAGLYICQHLTLHNDYQALDFEAADVRSRLAHDQGFKFIEGYDPVFYDPRDELRFSNLLSKQVVAEYRRSPLLFIGCSAENAFNYWFAGKNWTSTLLNVPVQLAYLVLAIWGAILHTRSRQGGHIGVYVLFCAYSMLVYVPIHAQARYSIPTVPLLALIGAAGIAAAVKASPASGSEPSNAVGVARS